MVRSDATYRLADLSTGTLGPASVGTYAGPQTMLARPSGGWACICTDWTASSGGSGLVVTFEPVAADGTRGTPVTLRTVRGESDPSLSTSDQPQLVDVAVSGSPDGRHAFVGWSARHGANGWTAGVDIVDLGQRRGRRFDPARGRPAVRRRQPDRHPGRAARSASRHRATKPSCRASGTSTARPPRRHPARITGSARSPPASSGALSAAGSTAGETCGEADSGPIDASTLLRPVRDAGRSARGRTASDRRVADRHDRRPGHELGPRAIVARPPPGRPPVHLGSGRGSTRAVRPAHRHDGQRRRHRPGAVRVGVAARRDRGPRPPARALDGSASGGQDLPRAGPRRVARWQPHLRARGRSADR